MFVEEKNLEAIPRFGISCMISSFCKDLFPSICLFHAIMICRVWELRWTICDIFIHKASANKIKILVSLIWTPQLLLYKKRWPRCDIFVNEASCMKHSLFCSDFGNEFMCMKMSRMVHHREWTLECHDYMQFMNYLFRSIRLNYTKKTWRYNKWIYASCIYVIIITSIFLPYQWFQSLFRCRIEFLNFSMGFNILSYCC